MKKFSLAVVAALLGVTGAQAADLPSRRAPSAPIVYAPAFTWTGFYAGVNAGYAFGDFKGNNAVVNSFDANGFVGGGQIGYNHQINQFVIGAETDIQFSDINDDVTRLGIRTKAELEYFGTVRLRAGYAVDRALFYVTGGYAYGGTKVSVGPLSDDGFHNGWTLGGGVEYAFTNNLSAKIEYLYVDLEKQDFFNRTVKAGAEFSVVRAGLNYRF
jgi:outer membrane immunogenic protein